MQTRQMGDFQPIARQGRMYWGISAVATTLVLGAGSTVAIALLLDQQLALAAGAVTVGMLCWAWWFTGRRWRAWGYCERERELVIRRGVLVERLVVVPYGRMQFVEVRQGPIDRMLGCSSVRLHTAAAATDAYIPWIEHDEATRLRARLTELGEAHAAGL